MCRTYDFFVTLPHHSSPTLFNGLRQREGESNNNIVGVLLLFAVIMNSEELKKMITSFIYAGHDNYELYNNHINNQSNYKPDEYNKYGKPKTDKKFGYKVTEDVTLPSKEYRKLKIKITKLISSGQIVYRPGINFLANGQTPSKGIYPYFCYDLNKDVLYLNYGTSDTNVPENHWSYSSNTTLNSVENSQESKIYKQWTNAKGECDKWDYDDMLKYLDNIIDDYEITLGNSRTVRANNTVGYGTGNVLSVGVANSVTEDDSIKGKEKDDKNISHPLNLILYGPPGTGKTYNTLFHALKIIKGDSYVAGKTYEDLKPDYDKLVDSGQIVFTTFHQSMSYEDFIEGIKPVVEGSEMTYKVQGGIFKELCERASQEYSVSNFNSCYDNFVTDVINKGVRVQLKSVGGKDFHVDVNSKGNLNLYTTDKQNFNGVLTKENIEKTYFGELDYWKGYMQGVIDHLKEEYKLGEPQKIDKRENYVLIIDEINRGNVAQIFGELITLIEPSKRLGNSEKMKAILPYSSAQKGEPVYFSVPNNLYIIGTMNTADRSVEALDTALRRRFSFEEMMPKPKLLGDKELCDVKLSDLLTTINQRIVALKDREHQIGHSYFMGHDDKNEDRSDKYPDKEKWLTNVFKDKIIPLLQEYFYGDYKKIYYVLGPGFVEKKTEKTIFAVENPDYDEFDIPEERYDIASFDAEFNIKDAIEKMEVQKLDSGTGATAESEESKDKE